MTLNELMEKLKPLVKDHGESTTYLESDYLIPHESDNVHVLNDKEGNPYILISSAD
jgi:hypothetical protein